MHRTDHEFSALTQPASGATSDACEVSQERAWVEAAQRGDPVAYNRLVLKWEQRIFNLALRMLSNREEAADAAQEVFLSAFRSLNRFKGDAFFSTWLHRIAINHCITRLRRRPPLMASIEESGEQAMRSALRSRDTGQDDYVLRLERKRKLFEALSLLSPQQRAVIELKVFEEETFAAIAGILEIAESTVKSRFYAALDALRALLGNEEDFHV